MTGGTAGNWSDPKVPCEPGGVPAQDPARIKRLNIDWMCPILDWIQLDNITACEDAGLPMWLYTSLEPHAQYNNFRIDNLLWQSRFLFWQVAQLRFTGFLPVHDSAEYFSRLNALPL